MAEEISVQEHISILYTKMQRLVETVSLLTVSNLTLLILAEDKHTAEEIQAATEKAQAKMEAVRAEIAANGFPTQPASQPASKQPESHAVVGALWDRFS